VLLEHVNVIDSTASSGRPDMSVLIEGDKIRSISPSDQNKHRAGMVIVDARGKFLIAGLSICRESWPGICPIF
jgi:imidazolonepropionase-like amidohydrolase